MKKLIFYIVTVPNTALNFVVTSERSAEKNLEMAMEKDAKVLEKIETETDISADSLIPQIVQITGNFLTGFDGGLIGDLPTEKSKEGFKQLAQWVKQGVLL
jgi:hypothetical protein